MEVQQTFPGVTSKTARIRELNDTFRRSFQGGRVVLTSGIAALDDNARASVLEAVRTFDTFDTGDDPYAEHDFGAVIVDDTTCFFKIDYYDIKVEYGADDPSIAEQTARVMTIMLASEY